jgi:GntR family transcriptional regulator, carbon starvation induced regulator
MKETLTDHCFHQLLQDILSGKYPPGQHLTLVDLKANLQAGLSPIREALSRLHASGFVDLENNKGFKVSKISELTIKDLIYTFAEVESLALQLAIEHGDLDWESRILGILHKLKELEESPLLNLEEWLKQNSQFHQELISACPYVNLLEIRERLNKRFEWFIRLAFTKKETLLDFNYTEHLRIAELTLAKDEVKASLLIKYHITNSLESIIQNLKKDTII